MLHFQIDETKVFWSILVAVVGGIWYLFTHWMKGVEDSIKNKVDKDTCNAKHDKKN